jgi:hypothetical protein
MRTAFVLFMFAKNIAFAVATTKTSLAGFHAASICFGFLLFFLFFLTLSRLMCYLQCLAHAVHDDRNSISFFLYCSDTALPWTSLSSGPGKPDHIPAAGLLIDVRRAGQR